MVWYIFRVEDDKKLISERFFFLNYDVMKSAMDREQNSSSTAVAAKKV